MVLDLGFRLQGSYRKASTVRTALYSDVSFG